MSQRHRPVILRSVYPSPDSLTSELTVNRPSGPGEQGTNGESGQSLVNANEVVTEATARGERKMQN